MAAAGWAMAVREVAAMGAGVTVAAGSVAAARAAAARAAAARAAAARARASTAAARARATATAVATTVARAAAMAMAMVALRLRLHQVLRPRLHVLAAVGRSDFAVVQRWQRDLAARALRVLLALADPPPD